MIQELAKYIASVSTLVVGTSLFIGHSSLSSNGMSDANKAIVLESVGGIPSYYLTDVVQKPIQILVQSINYLEARDLAYVIYNLLHGMAGVVLPKMNVADTAIYVNTCTANSTPYSLGVNQKGLYEFTMNFVFRIQNN